MRLIHHRPRRSGALLSLAAGAALTLSLGLAACSDDGGAAYQGYIAQWVGKPVSQLTGDWGPADYETTQRGLRELQYNYAQAISWGERPKYLTCRTIFLADAQNIVREATTEGDSCYISTSARPQARGH
jgi:hypothetical protein